MRIAKGFGLLLAGVMFVCNAQPASAISINELRIDDIGGDDHEYFELVGTPGESLDGLFYIVIGDSTAGASGTLERVIDLTGLTIPADGFFLGANAGVGTVNTDIAVPSVPSIDLTLGSNTFENSDNVTHLLVSGLTAAEGDDLDIGDTGTLATPFTSVIDGLSLLETPGVGELLYASQFGLPTIGPDGSFVPGHVFRIPDETGAFNIGGFVGATEDTPGISNIPEPASALLALVAIAGLGVRRRS